MSSSRAVIDVNELRKIKKQFDSNKRKREKAEQNRKTVEAIQFAKRLIKKIPNQLRRAALKGEQNIEVLRHHFSVYDEITAWKIIDFCNSNGLGYEHFMGKDEKGNVCQFLFVNFREK